MTVIVDKAIGKDANGEHISYQEIYGTSSEAKPTKGLVSGSTFTEVDTGDIYMFNETSSQWVKEFSLQG